MEQVAFVPPQGGALTDAGVVDGDGLRDQPSALRIHHGVPRCGEDRWRTPARVHTLDGAIGVDVPPAKSPRPRGGSQTMCPLDPTL